MALQIDSVTRACQMITREIRDYQKKLSLHFIVHPQGQRTEALGLATQDITGHPAAETALHLLQKTKRSENSAYLGTAVARQNIFFGLGSHYSMLALCTINIDEFKTLRDACSHAWHLAWHALDAAQYFDNDPRSREDGGMSVITRKHSALELARANLQADVFSGAVCHFNHDPGAAKRIAITRAKEALSAKSLHSPEYYPFAISLDATSFAIEQLSPDRLPRKRIIPAALRMAHEVARTYDEIALKHWFGFAEPAQDMAWRGYRPEEILGAAINTSPNTYIRATGYLIAELAEIEPVSVLKIRENYSPFADNAFNEQIHNNMISQIFADVVEQGLKQRSGQPFLNLANQQNAALTEGKVMGWCASALQAAGLAYETAREKGMEPIIFAREEFDGRKDNTRWADLRKLGKRIIRAHRQDMPVTMKDLEELAKGLEGLKHLRKSVEKTITDQHLRADLEQQAALRKTPSLSKTMNPAAAMRNHSPDPVPVAALGPVPGLGGNAAPITPAVQESRKTAEDRK